MEELDDKDVANMTEAMPELLGWLREYDRRQVMNAMAYGTEVKPKKKVWTTAWRDYRFGDKERAECYDVWDDGPAEEAGVDS